MKRLGTSTVQKPRLDWTEPEVAAAAEEIKTLARQGAQEWNHKIDEESWAVSVEPLLGGQVIKNPHLGGGSHALVTPTSWGVVVRWKEEW